MPAEETGADEIIHCKRKLELMSWHNNLAERPGFWMSKLGLVFINWSIGDPHGDCCSWWVSVIVSHGIASRQIQPSCSSSFWRENLTVSGTAPSGHTSDITRVAHYSLAPSATELLVLLLRQCWDLRSCPIAGQVERPTTTALTSTAGIVAGDDRQNYIHITDHPSTEAFSRDMIHNRIEK